MVSYTDFLINPIYHCYFCEAECNPKQNGFDKAGKFIRNNPLPRIYKITNLSKDDVILCGNCWDKYWGLIKAQTVHGITKELNKQDEERKISCGYCQKKYYPENMKRVDIGLQCKECMLLTSQERAVMYDRNVKMWEAEAKAKFELWVRGKKEAKNNN